MKTLYVIPARGGSKGIPGKNIKPLCGKPLIAYSIEVARQLAPDCDICVSTDDPAIANVAEQMGLKVPFLRPEYLATDRSGTHEVLLHALDFYAKQGVNYDTMVLLQPTSPMRTADDVRRALDVYSPDIDMVVTVKEAETNPYYNCYETDADGFLHMSKGDGSYVRRQDAPRAWEYNGAVYVINVASLLQMPMSRFAKRKMVEMSRERSVDLDTPIDWLVAEIVMQQLKDRGEL
ncbi:MAG: cytidylyltransferase domain-containing protein [Muribaculaceae bacterium]